MEPGQRPPNPQPAGLVRTYFEHMARPAALLSPQGVLEEANLAMRGLLNMAETDLGRQPVWALPRWTAEEARLLARCIERAAAGEYVANAARVAPAGDDAAEALALSVRPVLRDGGSVDGLVLEGAPPQAAALAALRRVARATAHDLNNVLTVLGGNLELMRRAVAAGAPAAQRLDKAVAAVFDGRALTDRLVDMARDGGAPVPGIDLDVHIGETLAIWRGRGGQVPVQARVQPGTERSTADPVQLRSLLLGILKAVQRKWPPAGAVQNEGVVIAAGNGPLSEGTVAITVSWPADLALEPDPARHKAADGFTVSQMSGRMTIELPTAGPKQD